MRLYHGTVHEFDAPDPGMGREATDFGVGFYATDSERMIPSSTSSSDLWRTIHSTSGSTK